ncbi:MAG: redoxin domain-containing protein [Actinomycetota bacterium]
MRLSRASAALVFCMAILLSACGGGSSSNSSESFVAGNGSVTFVKPDARKIAPPISGETLDGSVYNLTQAAKGKVSVVNVWASWCAPCRAEAPALSAPFSNIFRCAFVGILTRDNLSTARSFTKRFAVPYPTLVDDSI